MKRIITKNWLRLTLIFLISFSVTLVSARSLRLIIHWSGMSPDSNATDEASLAPAEDQTTSAEQTLPDFLDLQPIVDEWAADLPSNVGASVIVYDLDHQQTAATYNADQVYFSASLYKLFLAYDGYARASTGEINLNDQLLPDHTYGECLDLMIRESDNTCAEAMLDTPGQAERTQQLIDRLSLTNTTRQATYTTANDITKLLELYWDHPDLNAETWTRLSDSMLNQPPVEDLDWRQGLPQGFTTANVFAKVGWTHDDQSNLWTVYHDAIIADFSALQRHYIVVVMTKNLANANPLIDLGEDLENTILRAKTFAS